MLIEEPLKNGYTRIYSNMNYNILYKKYKSIHSEFIKKDYDINDFVELTPKGDK